MTDEIQEKRSGTGRRTINGPVRVLQVLTIMNRGGAEAMVMNYYRNLDRSKVQFDFLLHRRERGAYDDEIESLGGRIFRLPNIGISQLGKYLAELSLFFSSHPEYQIVHSHLNALSVLVLRAAQKRGVPVRIAHSHTSLTHINLNPFSPDFPPLTFILKYSVHNFLKRFIRRSATHYFSCGEKAGRWLFGSEQLRNVRIVPNAIPSQLFSYKPEAGRKIKQELGLDGNVVLGHVGNFVPEKNHPFLIQIFRELHKLNPKSKLMLVGGGAGLDNIRKIAEELGVQDHIIFTGVRKDVHLLMQAMDVFVFPSTNEGLPVTLIEAQAAGLHILASDAVTKELDITGNMTFYSLQSSPGSWAERLMEISERMRKDTRKEIISGKYDIEENARELQEFYLTQI